MFASGKIWPDSKLAVKIMCFNYSKFAKIVEYQKCYALLGVSEDSDQEEIRRAYLNLVKKYHPDSGSNEADSSKFYEIDRAFKILVNKKSKERWNVDDADAVEEHRGKHLAPQHRQYLSYDGVGAGTPSQRQKQYGQIRAMQATTNVYNHRVSKIGAEDGALLVKTPLKHNIKTKYGFDRLVEDLIQESMSRGEFSNLSGSGKPLPDRHSRNPYVDFVTHKLNEILIDNGFTPEWIMLQKEIREDIEELRQCLLAERLHFGPNPLPEVENNEWSDKVFKHTQMAEQINKKINQFNLVVPILNKQMIQVNLKKEADKVLINGQHSGGAISSENKKPAGPVPSTTSANIFDLFENLFKKE